MDFHSLTRRELQALCKKNKIPANLTNVAMADALTALEMVEGIEEIMNPSQSSIESDLASPYVPPTGGRSTRRRGIANEEPATVNPTTRTRRTTARKNLVNDTDESQADATNTPSLVPQPSRNRGRMASACRKMDSELKECADEEKKDILVTPAPVGAASRRRRVDEASVRKVYSTRRSVRLVEKSVEIQNEVEKEESEVLKKELLGENEDMDLEGGLVEKNVDIPNEVEKEESEVPKKVLLVDNEESVEDTNELSGITGADVITAMDVEEKCDDNTEDPCGVNTVVPLIVSNEVQQSDVENTEEQNTEKDAESQEKAADFVENVVLETKVDEFSSDNGSDDKVEKEVYQEDKDEVTEDDPEFDLTLAKFTDLVLQKATKEEVSHGQMLGDDAAEADSDFIDKIEALNKDEPAETEVLQVDESEKAIDLVPSDGTEFIDHLAIAVELNKGESAEKTEVLQLEESEKATDLVPSEGAEEVHFHPASLGVNANFGDDKLSHVFTPSKHSASKAHFATKRVTTGVSDNKENIGSGTKLVVMQDRVKVPTKNTAVEDECEKALTDLSVRKLSKLLKEKLEITNKSSKNEQQGKEATSRPALQALPENQLVD